MLTRLTGNMYVNYNNLALKSLLLVLVYLSLYSNSNSVFPLLKKNKKIQHRRLLTDTTYLTSSIKLHVCLLYKCKCNKMSNEQLTYPVKVFSSVILGEQVVITVCITVLSSITLYRFITIFFI